MKASRECYELIKAYEQLRLDAYLCPAGIWTIGWGTTRYPNGHPVRKGDYCTEEEASHYLSYDVEKAEATVNGMVRQPINQPMFDALTSFVYNVGISAFARSTLLDKINEGDWLGAMAEFDRWVKGGGQTLRGLVRRRDEEQALFDRGIKEALAFYNDYIKRLTEIV